jgi:AraC-like DNA-binding protein
MRNPDAGWHGSSLDLAGRELVPDWVRLIMAGEETSAPQRGTASQRALVAHAKRFIAQRPAERLRLSEVGRALGVSAVYVTDTFRQVEGVPLYRYVVRKRLERAVRLLPAYPLDLSALALELDFSSHSHFTTAFRLAFGCTPVVFRDRARRACAILTSRVSERAETPNRSAVAGPAHRPFA